MKKKQKIGLFILTAFLLLICIFILKKASQKMVYIEYQRYGELCDEALNMCDNEYSIEQEFEIPYTMFYGLSVKIGTYGRENNSRYELVITDKTDNKVIATKLFNVSGARDDQAYELYLKSPIKVDRTHKFSAIIKPRTLVNAGNGVAFYVTKGKQAANTGDFYYNNSLYDGNLCMNVYGGNSNAFWIIFTLFCEVYVVGLIYYIVYLAINKKHIKTNKFVQAGFLGIITFCLMFALLNMETFSDEVDNFVGGMLIQKGEVLYVDYISAHTPVSYLLCAIFAIFQASSEEQFRLMYYLLISLIYVGLFIRYRNTFGTKKMALLPVLQIIFGVAISENSLMVLSDNIQAICMVVLLLEFLQYLKDENLGWKRSIIVSLCVVCSFGAAFVSAYGIFAIVLGFFIKEVLYWIKNKRLNFKNLVNRYWKFLTACILPFILGGIYLFLTHSLIEFIKQAYLFNTEVYSLYLEDGYGTNVFQPFIIGLNNFIQIIPKAISDIIENREILPLMLDFIKIILGAGIITILIDMIRRKEYIKAVTLLFFISFNFTRTSEPFHEIAAWAIIVAVILLNIEFEKMSKSSQNISKIAICVACLFAISIYSNLATSYLFKKKESVLELAQKVVQETKDGEGIFLDVFSDAKSSTYLIYKNRLPINRLAFILPWYMDWYEVDTIMDLTEKQPKIVIYDEYAKVWEISGYDNYLLDYLHENYDYVVGNQKIWVVKQ